jgi:tetratricopeptide (TPR) repeat protein
VALYKMGHYDQSIKAYMKSSELKADDAQLQYNLGLAYFKDELYNMAVEHFRICA